MKTLKTFEEVSDRTNQPIKDYKKEADYLAGAIENNLLICINKSVLNKSNKDEVEQTMSSIHEQVGQLRDLLKNL